MSIAFIRGEVVWQGDDRVIVLTSSKVGYEILTNGADILTPAGEEVVTWVLVSYSQTGEQRFYGFKTAEQRIFAERMTAVPGVGVALAARTVQCGGIDVIQAIAAGNVKALVASTKGLGTNKAKSVIESMRIIAERLAPASAGVVRAGGSRLASAQEALIQVGLKNSMIDQERIVGLLKEHPDAGTGEIVRLYLATV